MTASSGTTPLGHTPTGLPQYILTLFGSDPGCETLGRANDTWNRLFMNSGAEIDDVDLVDPSEIDPEAYAYEEDISGAHLACTPISELVVTINPGESKDSQRDPVNTPT